MRSFLATATANDLPTSVDLQIDQILLHGYRPTERYRIGCELVNELTRLFVEQGIPSALKHGGKIETLDVGVKLAHNARPEAIGRAVAQAIYERLSK